MVDDTPINPHPHIITPLHAQAHNVLHCFAVYHAGMHFPITLILCCAEIMFKLRNLLQCVGVIPPNRRQVARQMNMEIEMKVLSSVENSLRKCLIILQPNFIKLSFMIL